MAEVLYYAIPFFMLLLVVECLSYRHLQADGLVGYELRDSRTSLAMGLGNVIINVGWKFAVLAAYAGLYELAPWHLPTDAWWVWVALFFADDLSYYWFHRVSPREPRVLGQPRRPPLQPALQPEHGAAADVGADDLRAVLAVAAARGLRAVDGAAGPGVVSLIYQFWHPHRARSAGCRGRSRRCSTRRRTTACTTAPTSSTSTRTTAASSSSGTGCSARSSPRASACSYGLTTDIETYNPVRVAFHEYVDLWHDMRRARSWRTRAGLALHGPGWRPAGEPELEPSSSSRG